MQCSQVYCIPAIFQDVRLPFVIKDIFNQLEQLDSIVNDVFQRVQSKVTNELNRIEKIDSRIMECQIKIQAIEERGKSNKPTTIFATAKYPAPEILPIPSDLFSDKSYAKTSPIYINSEEDIHYLPNDEMNISQRGQLTMEVIETMETLNPYEEKRTAETIMAEEGLGKLPEYIPSVGSLLLFNSSENPYQQYTSWDNLLGIDYDEEEKEKKKLANAPKTLAEGDILPSVKGLNYDFRPTLGQHSDLSQFLPQNLPLSNIATYNYNTNSNDVNSSIAPSLYQTENGEGGKNIKDLLPEIPTNFSFDTIVYDNNFNDYQGNFTVRGSTDLQMVPPPPPPLPSPKQGNSFQTNIDYENANINFSGKKDLNAIKYDIPPPPPPPPLMDMPSPTVIEPKKVPEPPKDPRISLLDAIRDPNNIHSLRRVKDNMMTNDNKKSKVETPLTIAEEMRERMNRRQAAISGKQDKMEQKKEKNTSIKTIIKAEEIIIPQKKNLPIFYEEEDDFNINNIRGPSSSFGDEGEMLAQLKKMQLNEDNRIDTNLNRPSANEHSNFEARMPGLNLVTKTLQNDSFDLSESSEWSDDD